ncbi:MAG: TPR end-of-group domain-containing protein [Pyrinomonadaceae bacterium]
MQKLSHQTHSFADFTLNLTRGCLLRGAQEIKLPPKPFAALKYLVENPGRLISKTELIKTIWPDTAVTDDSLVQCMIEVRRALSDERQQIIKTVQRRGYIFDKEVTENAPTATLTTYTEETEGVQVIIEEQTNEHGATEIAAVKPQFLMAEKMSTARRFTRVIWGHKIATAVGLAFVVVAVAGLARPVLTWWLKPPSIAILRIANATGDPNNDYVTDGLTESVIRSLAQINTPGKTPRLLVTAQNTVFAYKGREPRSVGRELGVDTVLASQMTEQNGWWFIKVEMIDVANGSEVWSKQYAIGNRLGSGFPQLQDNLAREVAANLPLRLSSEELQRLTRRYTQNPEAYDAFLKSRASWFKGSPEGYRKSIEYGQQAIDLDPNFALAYTSISASYSLLGVIGDMPMKDANDKSIEFAVKALKIDNTLRPALSGLQIAELGAWDWQKIEKEGRRHLGYSFNLGGYLIAAGRLDEQLAFENTILSFDQHNPSMNYFHANTLVLARQYDAAIEQYQKTLALGSVDGKPSFGPESAWTHWGLGNVYVQKGMFPEALAELNKAKELLDDSPVTWEAIGYAYAKSGQRDEALEILDRLQARGGRGEYIYPFGVAWIYAGLGDKDQAFTWLDKAFAERSSGLRQIKTDPIFDPLRSDPRFTDLLQRMKLPA